MATANNRVSTQVDYVLAFLQAPMECEVYMEIPQGYEMGRTKSKNDYAMLFHTNVYGQTQATYVWNKYLTKRLVEKAGFVKSEVDEPMC